MRQATGTRHCRICSSGNSTCSRYTTPKLSFIRARTLSSRAMQAPHILAQTSKGDVAKALDAHWQGLDYMMLAPYSLTNPMQMKRE